MVREIVTLQLGESSNYLATHFWNTQESYFTYSQNEQPRVDHDVHWRPGLATDGSETFLPRTVIYDFKSSFGSLSKTNQLYAPIEDASASSHLWHGKPIVHKQPAIEQNPYQKSLEAGDGEPAPLTSSSIKYWSDFSKVYFHPKSLVQLHNADVHPTQISFDRWSQGQELFETLDSEHDLLDRDLRPFIEECDLLQGLQVMTTIDDAWGGFAMPYLERMRDEYGKSCIWLWAMHSLSSSAPREKRALHQVNIATALSSYWETASVLIPLSTPQTIIPSLSGLDATSRWHTSALLSTGLESATIPTRLPPKSDMAASSLFDIAQSLNIQGKRTIARLQMSIGGRLGKCPETKSNASQTHATYTLALQHQPPQDKTKQNVVDFLNFPTLQTVRGRAAESSSGTTYSRVLAQRGDGASDGDEESAFIPKDEGEDGRTRPVTTRYWNSFGFPLIDSFPDIYHGVERDAEDSMNLAVETILSTDTRISDVAKELRRAVLPYLSTDDREAIGNSLAEIQEEYHEDWSSGSDSDDD